MKRQYDSLESSRKICIEVAFASSTHQKLIEMEVPANSTARKAVEESGLDRIFPDFDFKSAPIGVFGKAVPDDYLLADGNRVEVYRPLQQAPTDARRKRAKSAKNSNKY